MSNNNNNKELDTLEEQNQELAEAMSLIKSVKSSLSRKYGTDTFSDKKLEKLPSISTGSALLDEEINNKGIVLGRIHEIFGSNSSGKTTLATMLMKNALSTYKNKFVVYLDYEQAFDLNYANMLGLDVSDSRFIFLQPSSAEEGFDIFNSLIETGKVSLVVVDSVAAMLTKRELEKGFDEETMGEKARFLSKSLPKLTSSASKNNSAIVFINQVRDKIGLYTGGTTTPGGKSLPFYATTRLEIKRKSILTKSDVPYGQVVEVVVRKNKVGKPYGIIETSLIFGKGFDFLSELIDLSKSIGLIKGAAWLELPEGHCEGKINGKEKVIQFYRENQDKFEDLKRLYEIEKNKTENPLSITPASLDSL